MMMLLAGCATKPSGGNNGAVEIGEAKYGDSYPIESENTLTIYPTVYRGGTVKAANDHRIAMATAIAATVCKEPVTILGAECVQKSYPTFWEEFKRLGGKI